MPVATKSAAKPKAKPPAPVAEKLHAPPEAPTLAAWLFPTYLGVIFLGYALLRVPSATAAGEELGTIRALFWSVNAATLTGFPMSTGVDQLRPFGEAVMFALMLCGSLFSLIIGGTAVSRILRLGYSDMKIAVASMAAMLVAMTLGGLVLLLDQSRGVFQAVFLAASAFGNGGLLLGSLPPATSWFSQIVLLPLITIGGLGICVVLELIDLLRAARSSLSAHAQAALGGTAAIYVAGTAALLAIGLWSPHERDLRGLLAQSAAVTVVSRTAGMGLVNYSQLTRPAIWLVMLMMAAGACSGGTAGGVKLTTLHEIFRGVRRLLIGQPIGRAFAIALAWVGGYLLLVLAAVILLSHQMPEMAGDQILFDAISAASNVGAAPAPLDPDPGTAFALVATMLVGRFAPLMFIWWMADTTRDADLAVA
ncbi:MAG TPA: potassium transporter TrkG [Tepidisphaeraceae bacterium]|nr:potassium transporter TrkG [Tepidisphaeraceae bacterium]